MALQLAVAVAVLALRAVYGQRFAGKNEPQAGTELGRVAGLCAAAHCSAAGLDGLDLWIRLANECISGAVPYRSAPCVSESAAAIDDRDSHASTTGGRRPSSASLLGAIGWVLGAASVGVAIGRGGYEVWWRRRR